MTQKNLRPALDCLSCVYFISGSEKPTEQQANLVRELHRLTEVHTTTKCFTRQFYFRGHSWLIIPLRNSTNEIIVTL